MATTTAAVVVDPNENEPLYTDIQNRILSLVPSFTAPFSLVGSSLIIYVVVVGRRSSATTTTTAPYPRSTYDRIMLGLSVFDVLASTGFAVFGPWSIPAEVPYVVGARAGSTVPCDVGGFLVHMFVGSILYTAALMLYFILLIRWEWKPETIATFVEPALHVTCVVVTLASGIYAVLKGYMNPYERVPGTCWIGEYPEGCNSRTTEQDDGGELDPNRCLRGSGATSFARSMLGGTAFVTMFVIILAMILLFFKVRTTEQRVRRFRASARREAAFQHTRRISMRAFAYIGAFFSSYIPGSVSILINVGTNRTLYFFFTIFVVTLMPLQGFFNAIIYIYPRRKEFFPPRRLATQSSSVVASRGQPRSLRTSGGDGAAAAAEEREAERGLESVAEEDGRSATSSRIKQRTEDVETTVDQVGVTTRGGVVASRAAAVEEDDLVPQPKDVERKILGAPMRGVPTETAIGTDGVSQNEKDEQREVSEVPLGATPRSTVIEGFFFKNEKTEQRGTMDARLPSTALKAKAPLSSNPPSNQKDVSMVTKVANKVATSDQRMDNMIGTTITTSVMQPMDDSSIEDISDESMVMSTATDQMLKGVETMSTPTEVDDISHKKEDEGEESLDMLQRKLNAYFSRGAERRSSP